MKLKDVGEFGFIDRIAPGGAIRSRGVVKGIGDDCAVIDINGPEHLLVTTDLLVEKVHFLMEWAPAETFGAKALAVNLSDIAACGGRPMDAFVSIAVPERVDLDWLESLYRGMTNLARQYDVNLLGGDTTSSRGDLVINVALTGLVPRDEVLYRHTARPGNVIAVTGCLGESRAGLELLLSGSELPSEVAGPLKRAHLAPRPHLAEGRLLASSRACTAAIDISDGLSSDLWHLCADSGVAAVLQEGVIPVSGALAQAGGILGVDPIRWILQGGEDYVLLVALEADAVKSLRQKADSEGWMLVPIGEFVEGHGMQIIRRDGSTESLGPTGWDHFRPHEA
ncbi:MAG: thiamine-phosphate kinase [Desulfomonile sp.]|nr:thiamine-phosphate kinase [Desulfomonile sp.]